MGLVTIFIKLQQSPFQIMSAVHVGRPPTGYPRVPQTTIQLAMLAVTRINPFTTKKFRFLAFFLQKRRTKNLILAQFRGLWRLSLALR